MFRILVALTFLLPGLAPAAAEVGASSPSALHYTLHLHPGDTPRVSVSLGFTGEKNGSSTLAIAESWGGHENLGNEIHDLEIRDAAGSSLPYERKDDHTWSVSHRPSEPLTATWFLRPGPEKGWVGFEEHYYPLVTDDLLHLIGSTGLLGPSDVPDSDERDITLSWRGFREAGGKTTSSFGSGPDDTRVRTSLSRFRHALFLAGDVRLHPVEIQGKTLEVAIHGDDWGFTDEQFTELATRIVRAERDFFSDHEEEFFFVSVIPVGERIPGALSLGGTGLSHCFALFLMPGMGLTPGSPDEEAIQRILAHEYFHNWNGNKIHRKQPEQLVYWFSEGFTDFYARRLLHGMGLYSTDRYVEELNGSIREYRTSPVRAATNREILEGFWKSRALGDLPYRRGDLVALAVDEEIRRRSEGKASLDDVMRELVRSTVEEGTKWDTESLLAVFEERTSPEFTEMLRGAILEGKEIVLPDRLQEPDLVRHTETIRPFDLGFDFEASQAAGKITGLVEGSPAFEAGLRNDQTLSGCSIHWGRTDRPVVIHVEVRGKPRRIRYVPEGAEIEMPVYRPVEVQ